MLLRCSALALLSSLPSWTQSSPIRISGNGTGVAIMQHLALRFEQENPGLKIQVLPSIGSSGAIRAVADGRIEIGCSTRPLQQEEAARGVQDQPFARTPCVFAVQASNPLTRLSLEDVARYYEGRISTWPSGQPVRIVLRPKSDGAHALFAGISKALEAAQDQAHTRPGAIIAMTDPDMTAQIEKTPGSLGFTTLGILLSTPRQLKVVPLNGSHPTLENLASGAYPYSAEIRLVTMPGRTSASLAKFLVFLRSRPAGEILRRFGFLPFDPIRKDGR